MKKLKKNLLILFLLSFFISFSQKDSIVTYYNFKNKITKKKANVKFVEVATKKSDSLWLFRRFRDNGKIITYWHSKSSKNKQKIGQSVLFNYKDSIASIVYYNRKGLKHGKFTSWFENREINSEGFFMDGKKEGAWKFYHFNGQLAAKGFFKNDSLIRAYYFDEKGFKIEKNERCCKESAKFNGGNRNFINKIRSLINYNDDTINNLIRISFRINIDGDLADIRIYGYVPISLNNKLVGYLKNLKGWQPAKHLGRKIPSYYAFDLKFK